MKSSKFKKKYRVLFLDVDGTLVPYDYNKLPSDNVSAAVKKAQEKIAICLVTGRSYPFLKPVLKKLGIRKGYVVVNNGSHVVNLEKDVVLYDQPMDKKDTEVVAAILHKEKVSFFLKQHLYHNAYINSCSKEKKSQSSYMFYTNETYSSTKIDEIAQKLSRLSNLSVYKTKHKKGHGLNIQHASATKLHGIEIVMKKLSLNKEDAIGVGESYNDFPLLMACGLKVAMGNAVDDLKAIADYIAPTVDEDGVADVIKKFVLN